MYPDGLKGAFDLECFPSLPASVAVPADAADDYLIQCITPDQTGLIINDRFGALACALPQWQYWSDSASAIRSCKHNLQRNQILFSEQRFLNRIDGASPENKCVIIKIPKNHEQLHYWLNQLADHLPNADIWLGGMAKHIPVSLLKWLEANSDNYEQLPIRKKARAIRISGWRAPSVALWKSYEIEGNTISGLPGVFCRDQPDIGARAILPFLPLIAESDSVIDLGCGNGILSIMLKRQNPAADVIAIDDSAVAVESVRYNAEQNDMAIQVIQNDSLAELSIQTSAVVCNPPFHDGHLQLTNIATRMFEDAKRALLPNGTLLVVANSHLAYLKPLKALFNTVTRHSAGAKFVIYECR